VRAVPHPADRDHPARVIVALGKFAAQTLLRSAVPITRLRGQFHPFGAADVMPRSTRRTAAQPRGKREVWRT